MTTDELQAYLKDDPDKLGVTIDTPAAEAAAVLNEARYQLWASTAGVKSYCLLSGVWGKCEAIAQGYQAAPADLRGLCATVVETLEDAAHLPYLDVGSTAVVGMLDTLVAVGIASAGDKAAVLAMGHYQESAADRLGGVSAKDILLAQWQAAGRPGSLAEWLAEKAGA